MVRSTSIGLALLATLCAGASAQDNTALTMERQAYTDWLTSAATSPLAAVALQRLDHPVSLGPDSADIPLAGFGRAVVEDRKGAVVMTGPGASSRPLPKGRPVTVGRWTLQAMGTGGSTVLLVYGTAQGKPPGWYDPDPRWSQTVAFEAAGKAERRRVLTLDGIDVEAEVAGFVTVRVPSGSARLQVMRMPVPGTEEVELQVYFRDQTNDRGTYPAGRFVELIRTASGTYRLDFNRARNPFCAYSSVYPCPVPWSGNALNVPVEAGEKYLPSTPARPGE